jgi:very-short-patch-repair endonuclease
MVDVRPVVGEQHQAAIIAVGTAFQYAARRTPVDGAPPVVPVLACPTAGAGVEVLCASGPVGTLVGAEGAGWNGLAVADANRGRALAGWIWLMPSRRRGYQMNRLWLTAPLDVSPAGAPVDLPAIRWPTHTSRSDLTRLVTQFPQVSMFPDPATQRASLLRAAGAFAQDRRGSRNRRYAEALSFAARTHGATNPPAITRTERRLAFYLQQMPTPFEWIPQVPIGRRRMDLYNPYMKICVEVDGSSHDNAAARADDECRDHELRDMGITTWRYRDAQVEASPTAVADDLARRMARRRAGYLLKGWTSRRLVPVGYLPPSLSFLASRSRRL